MTDDRETHKRDDEGEEEENGTGPRTEIPDAPGLEPSASAEESPEAGDDADTDDADADPDADGGTTDVVSTVDMDASENGETEMPPPEENATGPPGQEEEPPAPEELEPKEKIKKEVIDDVWAFFEEQAEQQRHEEEAAAAEAKQRSGVQTFIDRLRRRFGTDDPTILNATPEEEFIRQEWFDFSYLDDYQEVERTWVSYPYAYVSILYDPDQRRYRYQVVEPQLSKFEQYIRNDLTTTLRNSLMYRDINTESDRESAFTEMMREVLHDHAAALPDGTVAKLRYYYTRDFLGYGHIDPLMHDRGIEDISCDGENIPVYIYHREYRDLRTNVRFDTSNLNSTVVKLAQRAGKHISVSNPLVDASLPDGSRIQLTLGTDVSTRGSNFTIRKFSEVPHTPVDLIKWNTFSIEQMAYFWLAIENNMSLIFAGGTGSGKTTSMNAISLFIPPDSKIVSIEDTRELVLPQENWVQSTTRESATATGEGDITTHNLLQAALRQRPEYILVGEIRTEQRVALTFFQAIGTGHTAYSTFHADSVNAALARLQNPPLSVPAQMLRNLDIISIQRQVTRGKDRLRRNEAITEIVEGNDEQGVQTEVVFEREPGSDEHRQVADSTVLERIAYQQGWSAEELEAEHANRREVLSYLVEEDITDFDDVTNIIMTYSRAPEDVLEYVRSDSIDAEELFAR